MLQMADVDVTRERLITGEIRQQIQDLVAGKLDAVFVTSAVGSPTLQAIPAPAKVQLLAMGQEVVTQGQKTFPEAAALYRPITVPAGTYPWNPNP